MFSRLHMSLLLVLVAISSGTATERTWTSTDGRTMRAEFVREIDGEVTFLKDGKIVTLRLDLLSERDRQIVRDLAAGKPVEENPAPATSLTSPPVDAPPAAPPAAIPGTSAPAEATSPKPLVNKPLAIENRTWTDIHGNQMTGKYVRIFGSNVVLARGGRSMTVKFYELSQSDQDYLRELLTSRGQEGIIPPRIENLAGNANEGTTPQENTEPPAFDGGTAPAAAPDSLSPAPGVSDFAGPGGSFPGPGSSFPGSIGPGIPAPGGQPLPGPRGSAFPGGNPGGLDPLASPPGFDPTPHPGFGPPGASAPGSSPADSMRDRFQQQIEESNRRQMESLQRMQDRMNQRHESLFNRHGSTGECLNCKHSLNEAEMRRTSCPHCGVTWDYEIDEYGNKRQLNNSSFSSPFAGANNAGGNNNAVDARTARMIGLVIGIFIGLAVVVGMIIGTIYIIMSIASASSSSQQRQYR